MGTDQINVIKRSVKLLPNSLLTDSLFLVKDTTTSNQPLNNLTNLHAILKLKLNPTFVFGINIGARFVILVKLLTI